MDGLLWAIVVIGLAGAAFYTFLIAIKAELRGPKTIALMAVIAVLIAFASLLIS